MKKICVVTAARSDYCPLKWIMHDINENESFQLQIIVSGGHLLNEQGHTIDNIIADGFKIDAIVDANLDTSSSEKIAASMGRMAEKFSETFTSLKPDCLVVLGDRYELLPICNTAFVMHIPIIHISGGDVTEGAIDNGVRNAVTMLADYHFPSTEDSARNIKRMRGNDKNIWPVGEPGLDAFNRMQLMSRDELARDLKLDMTKKWCLMTYHSETLRNLEYNLNAIQNCHKTLSKYNDFQVVMTYANADLGGKIINESLESIAARAPQQFKAMPSLGQLRYLSFMKQVKLVIGNSSSGIIEAPFLKVPVINIGDRQKGRHLCKNVIQCKNDTQEIQKAIELALNKTIDANDCKYWGDGHTSEKILQIMHEII